MYPADPKLAIVICGVCFAFAAGGIAIILFDIITGAW